MALEIAFLPHFEDAVFSHRRKPDQVAAGFIVLRIFDGPAEIADDALHEGFVNAVRHIIDIGGR